MWTRFPKEGQHVSHLIRACHFAVVRNTPCVDGQSFRPAFYPDPGAIGEARPQPVNLLAQYRGATRGKYLLARDGASFKLRAMDKQGDGDARIDMVLRCRPVPR
ncbi:hypothetical protein [Janthinobacterium sp.]|uniref:hypothetical protein n=1 Tax=Janthinobacterium sp. TaxID=1871054 RepID=UPI00293D5645|nr:hypothetical protein [Janthinobacterium sp.]